MTREAWKRDLAMIGGVFLLSACSGVAVASNGVEPPVDAARWAKKADLDSSIEASWVGVYVRPGEFHSNPVTLKTKANTWDTSKNMGCMVEVKPEEYVVATWFYPCGTILEIKNINPTSGGFGKSVLARVVDRGPNRYKSGKGWENDRIYGYAMDVSASIRLAIGQEPGEGSYVEVSLRWLPEGYEPGQEVDLVREMEEKFKYLQARPAHEQGEAPCWSAALNKWFEHGQGGRYVCVDGDWKSRW